jgi:hypothetical protein
LRRRYSHIFSFIVFISRRSKVSSWIKHLTNSGVVDITRRWLVGLETVNSIELVVTWVGLHYYVIPTWHFSRYCQLYLTQMHLIRLFRLILIISSLWKL